MTKIAFIHSEGVLVGFDAHGHTGYADAGEDIVCAAVSALTQATVIGMQEVLSLPVRIERDDRAGRLMAVVAPEHAQSARVLLETLRLSLSSICAQYPGYVRLTTREWRV